MNRSDGGGVFGGAAFGSADVGVRGERGAKVMLPRSARAMDARSRRTTSMVRRVVIIGVEKLTANDAGHSALVSPELCRARSCAFQRGHLVGIGDGAWLGRGRSVRLVVCQQTKTPPPHTETSCGLRAASHVRRTTRVTSCKTRSWSRSIEGSPTGRRWHAALGSTEYCASEPHSSHGPPLVG